MGNPFFEDDDPSTKDEAIYAGILDWKSNWKLILSYSGLIVFVFGPILYILLWFVSIRPLCPCRKHERVRLRYLNGALPADEESITVEVEKNHGKKDGADLGKVLSVHSGSTAILPTDQHNCR